MSNRYVHIPGQFSDSGIDWTAIIAQGITETGKYMASRRQNTPPGQPPTYNVGFTSPSSSQIFWSTYGMYIIFGGLGLLALIVVMK